MFVGLTQGQMLYVLNEHENLTVALVTYFLLVVSYGHIYFLISTTNPS
jgi:hypothetical protein